MANFKKSLDLMLGFEFSSARDALHKNKTENGLTYKGIYETAHPKWRGWGIIKEVLADCDFDIKEASEVLFDNAELDEFVAMFYRSVFWDAVRGDEIKSQKIADELFCFAVNAGVKTAIKTAQKVVSETADGILGDRTLARLNSFDDELFDELFDEQEIAYYERIIRKNPSLKIYRTGWYKRANKV